MRVMNFAACTNERLECMQMSYGAFHFSRKNIGGESGPM